MNLPLPGSSFAQAMSGRNNIVKTTNRMGGRATYLPSAPINSSLQTLSPSDWALLGLGAVASAPQGQGPYTLHALKPNDTIPGTPGNPYGVYGEVGERYEIHLFEDEELTAKCWTGNFNMYGPITPSAQPSPNGEFMRYVFDGFDEHGQPYQVGGSATVSNCIWEIDREPKGFTIVPEGEPSTPGLDPIPGSDKGDPVTIPEMPTLPGISDPAELQREFDEASEERNDIKDALIPIAQTAAQLLKEITEKLTCVICEVENDHHLENLVKLEEIKLAVDEVIRRTFIEIDTTVDINNCDGELDPIHIQGDTFQQWLNMHVLLKAMHELNKDNICAIETTEVGIPEEWTLRKNPGTPVLILNMRESTEGHTGTAKTRAFSLPDFNADRTGPFPSWIRGDYRCSVKGSRGTKLTIWAESASEARRVADTLADMCDGFDEKLYVTGHVPGTVVNDVRLTPFKTQWFPTGRRSGLSPAETHYLEIRR